MRTANPVNNLTGHRPGHRQLHLRHRRPPPARRRPRNTALRRAGPHPGAALGGHPRRRRRRDDRLLRRRPRHRHDPGRETTTFGLDAAARRTVRSDTDTAAPGTARKTISYYTGDDDNPDVVKEPDNSHTRNIASFGGLAATVTKSGTAGATVTLQLANLHGDIAATVPTTSTSANDLTVTETTEYGIPRTAPATGTTQARYGWLGTHQRDTSTPGGLTLMGVRLYTPTLGRFLSVDPVPGGNANAYVYPADPIGKLDLDGKKSFWSKAWRSVKRNYKKVSLIGARVLSTASTLISLCPLPQCRTAGLGLGLAAAGAYWVAGQGGTAKRQAIAAVGSFALGFTKFTQVRRVAAHTKAPKRTLFNYQKAAGARGLAGSLLIGRGICGSFYPVYCG